MEKEDIKFEITPEERQKFLKDFKVYVPSSIQEKIPKIPKPKSKSSNLVILILSLFIVILSALGFLVYKKIYSTKTQEVGIPEEFKEGMPQNEQEQPLNQTPEQISEQEETEPKEELAKIDKFAEKTYQGIDLGKVVVTLNVPKDKKDLDIIDIKAYTKEEDKTLPEIFKEWILGAIFEVKINKEFINQEGVITISYNENLIKNTDFIESDLRPGFYYLNSGLNPPQSYLWEIPENFKLDDELNTLTTKLPQKEKFYIAVIPSSINDLILAKYNQLTPVKEISITQDSDGDGFTDIEESIFKTNAAKKDTDSDSYNDSIEVQYLYDPLRPGDKKLFDSDSVEKYETQEYSFLIPKGWQVKELKGENGIMIIPSEIEGEFFEILLLENPKNLPLKEWYKELSPYTKEDQIEEIELKKGEKVIQTKDGLNIYIPKDNYVYALIYNIGIKKEISLPNIFKMFARSFEIKISPKQSEVLKYLESLNEFKCEMKSGDSELIIFRKDNKAKVDLKDNQDHIVYIVIDKDKYVYDSQNDKWIKIKDALPDGVETENEVTSKKYLSTLPKDTCKAESINDKIFYIPEDKIIETQ